MVVPFLFFFSSSVSTPSNSPSSPYDSVEYSVAAVGRLLSPLSRQPGRPYPLNRRQPLPLPRLIGIDLRTAMVEEDSYLWACLWDRRQPRWHEG
ncbi:hypothetical protein PVAP13_8KG310133 [Panicum virgatum]|uniref:Uncharacterized protein n=1 Tax=Panicum virgatum TaxID=38727 RepID=A0A8T0PRT7_PANVG|nr:hypothetical protein PVAP13_8KG310133 [Panicum virgatum]